MGDKIRISYHTAKGILLDLLENNDFSTDEDIMNVLNSVISSRNSTEETDEKQISGIIIDKDGRIFLPGYSNKEIKMPYLPKTVFIFFLLHEEGIEFKSMHYYIQELYEIYQIVALERNTEAGKIRRSIINLVEPVNNRIYEICSIIRRNLIKVVPPSTISLYCITGKRGEKRRIRIGRMMMTIENKKLKKMFETKNGIMQDTFI